MPRIISTAQEVAYLATLAATGNATLAAERAGVSRTWAYKKRAGDAGFAALCREMAAIARARRTRVNRDRADGWTADKEARFLERLLETCSVWLAAAEVGLTAKSAYRRRQARPEVAAAWAEAERAHWPPLDQPWIAAAICVLEGEPPPPGNPVRFTRVGEVLQAMRGNKFVARRARPSTRPG